MFWVEKPWKSMLAKWFLFKKEKGLQKGFIYKKESVFRKQNYLGVPSTE